MKGVTIMLPVRFPTRHELRRQIAHYGPLNQLRNINERILSALLGHQVQTSYLRFVPGKHLDQSSYVQAKLCFEAATFSLSTIEGYVEQGDDPLLEIYWEHFLRFAEFGNNDDMEVCKDILNFVKNVEYKNLQLTHFSYLELARLAKYSSIDQYPMDYIMRFDSINEYDRYIPKEDKLGYELEYAAEYLSPQSYTHGNGLANRLKRALNFQVHHLLDSGVGKSYLGAFMAPSKEFLGKISNTQCAAGSKRYDFWNRLAEGVTHQLYPVIKEHIDILNRLYNLDIDYPRVTKTGMELWEYLPMLIIQEDPKKRRTAYKSNPILDAIGDVGMAADKIMFSVFPNILCGRKRDTSEDIIEDKTKYAAIERVYEYSKSLGLDQVSTDLSACTENLNMIDYQEMLQYRLLKLNMELGLPYDPALIIQRVRDICSVLYKTGLTLSEDKSHSIYYMRKGQMAGLRKSFHSMTDELATIQLEAMLDIDIEGLYNLRNTEDLLNLILENGDDGVIPEPAFGQFQYLLEITTGEGVLNEEKSFRSRDTKSLEFCKTIYYDSKAKPITGYRYASLYKLANRGRDLVYLNSGLYKRDKEIFINFLEAMDFPDQRTPEEEIELQKYAFTYHVLTDPVYIKNGYACIMLWDALRILYTLLEGTVAERNSLPMEIQNRLPKGIAELLPKDTYYLVTDGDTILRRDFRLLENLDKKVEHQWGLTFEGMLADEGHLLLAENLYEDITGCKWNGMGTTSLENPQLGINIVPVSTTMAETLGLDHLRAIVVTDDRNTSEVTKALVMAQLESQNHILCDMEILKHNTTLDVADIKPVISVEELVDTVAQYYQLETVENNEAPTKITDRDYKINLELLRDSEKISKKTYSAICNGLYKKYRVTEKPSVLLKDMSIQYRTRLKG